MKVLLIPNPVLELGKPKPYVPLGILSLATILKKDGFQAEILDVNEICQDTSYSAMPDAICACEPDVVGFSTWCNYYLDVIKTAAIIRKRLPHTKIIFGGVQATHTDKETLEEFPHIDVVARGECDLTISRIISSIHDPDALQSVPGVSFMRDGKLVRTTSQGPVQDLNLLPLPDYSLLPSMEKIYRVGIDVGRGCPFQCGYCVANSMGQGKFRQRSVENVVTMVKRLIADYGAKLFRFEHDMLTLNRKWLIHLCTALENENLEIEWECFSRIDTIDDEMIAHMKASGCSYIYFGIETGSPRMQRLLNKRLDLSLAPTVIRKVSDAGIENSSGFIFGFPQERQADMAQTMRLILEIFFCNDKRFCEPMIWSLVPFPGSPLFQEFGKNLGLDEHTSIFATSSSTWIDPEFIKKYPQVSSVYYHFLSEHVSRGVFLRVVFIMRALIYLKYTALALLKDPALAYPESLLNNIMALSLPEGNMFHASLDEARSIAAEFITKTFGCRDFKDHYIHDVLKLDLALSGKEHRTGKEGVAIIKQFSYDVMAFMKEAKANRFQHLPVMRKGECSVLFRKRGDDQVDCVKLPDSFKGIGSNVVLGKVGS